MKLTQFPHLVEEWHPDKNGDLTPEDVTHGSSRKVWWLCSNGHSYESRISDRTRKGGQATGCPYCSGRLIGIDNSLEAKFPDIAKEWHPTKNKDLLSTQVASKSHKKVWWLCSKGHSYDAVIGSRTASGHGCPYCSGRRASSDNNLTTNFPEIAKEWHPFKNGSAVPEDFTKSSHKKVWWLCPKGHSYNASINSRTNTSKTRKATGCPYCSGNKVASDASLLKKFPEVAKEWHPTKNKSLTPEQVAPKSHKKIWWVCPRGHSYQAQVTNRTHNRSRCPFCSHQTSDPEIRILSELKWIFQGVVSRHKFEGVEIDVFLPEFNIGIEYDGSHWHKGKEKKDLEKVNFLLSNGIDLIRVREYPLEGLSERDIVVKSPLNKCDLNKLLERMHPLIGKVSQDRISEYLKTPEFVNEKVFNKYRSYLPSPFPENSLQERFPLVAKEWDYDKNYPLTPENFSYGSDKKVWWICANGHSFDATIKNRTSKESKCPFCSGKVASKDNNLALLFPEVAREWHPTKNGDLTPKQVTSKSSKKVWWLCPKGHSYEKIISSRTRDKIGGCPYCSGHKSLNYELF